MIEVKTDFTAGLDLDDSLYQVPPNAYIDAINITRDAVDGSADRAITNIIGNRLVDFTLPDGRNKIIGAYPNTLRNTVLFFLWNENNFHLFLEYNNNTRTISPILRNLTDSGGVDILGFTENEKITSINVYPRDEGDLVFFLDSLSRPTKIDIEKFRSGLYTPVFRDILDVAVRPPMLTTPCVYGNDTTKRTNSLRDKLFRFKIVYVYDNNEESTASPISQVPLPLNILDDTYNSVITNNNVIYLSLFTGDKDVKNIKLLMSYANKTSSWSDFVLVDNIQKKYIAKTFYKLAPQIGNKTDATIGFIGEFPTNTVVNVYLNQLPSTQVLTATYTVQAGDTVDDIINGLITSTNAIGIGTFPSNFLGQFVFEYDNLLYSFNRIDVISSDITNDNIVFPYSFYNDSTYPVYDINKSIELFDYVPDKANAQEMPNGNTLMYGGITEGYDKDLVPNVINTVLTTPAGNGNPTGNLIITHTLVSSTLTYRDSYSFIGIPAVGTNIILRYKLFDSSIIIVSNYTTVIGDNAASVAFQMRSQIAASPIGGAVSFVYDPGTGDVASLIVSYPKASGLFFQLLTVTPPSGAVASNSIATFKFSTEERIGIAYFDNKGKTNGILYNDRVAFPAYSENDSQAVLLPYINSKIYHIPPIWAYTFAWYLTKENTQFLYWETNSVVTEDAFIYYNVSSFEFNATKSPSTISNLSYSFQEGDRVRIIRRVNDNTVYNDTYDAAIEGLVKDPTISGNVKVGLFIKVKRVGQVAAINYNTSTNFFVIQIYRSLIQQPNNDNQVYYEFGQHYSVINPTLPTRYHSGMITDQNIPAGTPAEFNFYSGDVYFRLRTIALTEETSGSTGPGSFNVIDRNFVDIYPSAVNVVDGRPNIIDVNAKRSYYSTLVRYSEAYQANTNINGLNRFYPDNFDEYDLSFGDIKRLKVRDRFVRVFQKFKIGQVPLYHQILKENNKETLVVTDRLLNPIQYYVGDLGIGDNAESLASYNFADYFTTNIKGIVGRVSNDGIQFLSIDRKINSWATVHIPLRTGNFKIYGAFDQQSGNYIIALEATDTDDAYTLIYDEELNSFEAFRSLFPEMMTTLGTLLISFKDGQLWTHDSDIYNNFFGVQYDSSITMIFNKTAINKKTFLSICEIASKVWEVPEIKSDINSFGTTKMKTSLIPEDFAQLEGDFESAILRDENSPGGILNGDTMKGKYLTTKLLTSDTESLVALNLVSLKYIDSPLNVR